MFMGFYLSTPSIYLALIGFCYFIYVVLSFFGLYLFSVGVKLSFFNKIVSGLLSLTIKPRIPLANCGFLMT